MDLEKNHEIMIGSKAAPKVLELRTGFTGASPDDLEIVVSAFLTVSREHSLLASSLQRFLRFLSILFFSAYGLTDFIGIIR